MMIEQNAVYTYLDELRRILSTLNADDISQVIYALLRGYRTGRKVFILGNGGSAATASHFACDLGKSVVGPDGRRFKVVALTDNVALLTAWANDTDYDRVFAEQLENLVEPDDLVVGISGSGNSPNVLRAMELAKSRGAMAVGLTGFEGGRLKSMCDVCVVVPSDRMDQIENVHLALEHLICRVLRGLLVGEEAGEAVLASAGPIRP